MSNDVPDKEAEVPGREFPLTEVAVDRDCVITFGDKDYQLFAGQSFTIMLGKLTLTGPAERDGIPTLQQKNYAKGREDAIDLISAKRDEWQRLKSEQVKLDPSQPTTEYLMFRDYICAANELLALLTGENKDSECEAKGDSTTT